MLGGDLGDLKKTHGTLVLNQSTTLHISDGLVSDLHQELDALGGGKQVVEDVDVNSSTKVVDVGDKNVLLALSDQSLKQARVLKSFIDITMAGGVPVILVVEALGHRKKGIFVEARVLALVERQNVDSVVRVLLDNALGLLVCVERVHEKKRDIGVISFVQLLDLADGQVQESHIVTNFNSTLRTSAAHGGTKTTIEFENNQFREQFLNIGVFRCIHLRVGSDSASAGGFDLVPVDGCILLRKEALKQHQEAINLLLEQLRIRGKLQQSVKLILHDSLSAQTSHRVEVKNAADRGCSLCQHLQYTSCKDRFNSVVLCTIDDRTNVTYDMREDISRCW
eukprot:Colp12_sorted_trinity150504_noHs@14581